jgi:hypothetical protein
VSKRPCAVFTIAQNEPKFLRIWAQHYRAQLGADNVFVLDHDSDDRETLDAAGGCVRVPVHRTESFDHMWLRAVVQDFQRFLLNSYHYVLFAEADEIVAVNRDVAPAGLLDLAESSLAENIQVVKPCGYEVLQERPDDPVVDWARPLLRQRPLWCPRPAYSKPTFAAVPMRWGLGFHQGRPADPRHYAQGHGPDVVLIHLHRLDYAYCFERNTSRASRPWSQEDLARGWGVQNRITDEEVFRRWFYSPETVVEGFEALVPEPIPEHWLDVL